MDRFEPDALDWTILELLQDDATISNKQLAAAVGLAPSTCLARVRRLRERGILTGFHADVPPEAVGLGLQAILSVRVRPHTRAAFGRFVDIALAMTPTQALYHVSGEDDFLVHVAVADAPQLQQLVIDLMSHREQIVHVRSSIVYEQVRVRTLRAPDPMTANGESPLIASRVVKPHARDRFEQ